jgi:uncharacterized protein
MQAAPLDNRILTAFDGGFDLSPRVVCAATMGSHSHNTYVPKDDPDSIDDVDIMGIVVPPLCATIGLRKWEHWTWQHEELDVVLYSLHKFVGLLLKGNPNVVGVLWLRPTEYITVHPAFRTLIENREVFNSQEAFHAFSGYAHAQLKKLETGAFKGYMGAKRKALVEKHGYDAKMAAHAIRLLRMGSEFLETGSLKVYRDEDAEEIRAIKRGEWTLEQVKAEAERGFERATRARENSPLPERPDFAKAEQLMLELTLSIWRDTGDV